MMTLGNFDKDEKTGKLIGIFYGVNMYPTRLVFEPTLAESGKSYYKIFAQCQHATVEAGAAWPKESKYENGKPYMDVKLDSPGLSGTFYGRLTPSDVVPNQYALTWSEPKHAPKAEAHATVGETPARRPVAGLTP